MIWIESNQMKSNEIKSVSSLQQHPFFSYCILYHSLLDLCFQPKHPELKGNIHSMGNVGKTASKSMLSLFESLNQDNNIWTCESLSLLLIGHKKVSGFWSSVGFKSGALMHFFFLVIFFFGQQGNTWSCDTWRIHVHGDHISHIPRMVAKRGLTNQANVHIPLWKSRLTYLSSNFGCNWTSFRSQKNKKI